VSLRPQQWLEGRVVNSDGEPIAGARVGYVADPYPVDHLRLGMILGPLNSLTTHLLRGATGASVDPRHDMKLDIPFCLQTPEIGQTGSDGRFSLPPRNPQLVIGEEGASPSITLPPIPGRAPATTNDFIVVVHEEGITEIPVQEFHSPQTIQLKPLGALRIRAGSYPGQFAGRGPVFGQEPTIGRKPLSVVLSDFPFPPTLMDPTSKSSSIVEGPPGEWLIRDLPPGPCTVSIWQKEVSAPGLVVLPGVTNEVRLLTNTFSLKGRVTTDADPELVSWRGASDLLPSRVLRFRWSDMTPVKRPSRDPQTQDGRPPFVSPLRIEDTGEFTIAAAEPGDYVLNVALVESPSQLADDLLPPLPTAANQYPRPRSFSTRRIAPPSGYLAEVFSTWNWMENDDRWYLQGGGGGVPAAFVAKEVTVPPLSSAPNDLPIDLGVLELKVYDRLTLGQMAPDVTIEQADMRFDPRDHRGTWSLLIFTSESLPFYQREEWTLGHYANELKAAGKIEVVVLDLDTEPPPGFENPKAPPNPPWKPIPLGPWKRSAIAAAYHVRAIPEVILINPEGRIAALHLRGQRLLDVVDAISPPPGAPTGQ